MWSSSGGRRAHAGGDTATPFGMNLALGAALVVVAVMVAAVIPPVAGYLRFGLVAGAVGLFAAVTLDRLALLGVAAIAWLLVNGFLVNRLGELSWHGWSDIWRIMLLAGAGNAGLLVGEVYRLLVALWSRRRFQAALNALLAHVYEEEKRDA